MKNGTKQEQRRQGTGGAGGKVREGRTSMATFANFPYEVVETSGENALAMWEELKNAGRGAPVVLGEEELHNLLFPFDPSHQAKLTPIEEILAAAEPINFP